MTDRRGRLLATLSLAVLPWTVVVRGGVSEFVFVWGLVDAASLHVVDLYSFLGYAGGPAGLPDRLLAWPIASVVYLLAVASVCPAWVGREDRRVSAGLLALSGLAHLQVTLGLARLGELAVPVGAVLAFPVAWWSYAGDEEGLLGR